MKVITDKDSAAPTQLIAEPAQPGLLVSYSGHRPLCQTIALSHGEKLLVGRDVLLQVGVQDTKVSGTHLTVQQVGGQWELRDCDSRNGSFVNGEPIKSPVLGTPKVIRIGHTLLHCVADIRPYQQLGVRLHKDTILGPTLQAVHAQIVALAKAGHSVLFQGESGVGKELAARAFHLASPASPKAPFVAVNCATIPRDISERLLFGTLRGAYSGAVADSIGYIEEASGGTLFLDEVGELDTIVQAKLLRVLETQELIPLGGTRPRKVDIRLCFATLHDLRSSVASGKFREDLFFRIGRPSVRLPALRERVEEIPWLVKQTLGSRPVRAASVHFIEQCILRPWPGNVRELLSEVQISALRAEVAKCPEVLATHLDDQAGRLLANSNIAPGALSALTPQAEEALRIWSVVQEFQGNVSRAAKQLGMDRCKLRRMIAKHTPFVTKRASLA